MPVPAIRKGDRGDEQHRERNRQRDTESALHLISPAAVLACEPARGIES
jgi:hypothetical protein